MLHDMLIRQQNIQTIESMSLSDYPNMKQQDRKRMHRSVRKLAYPEHYKSNMKKAEDI